MKSDLLTGLVVTHKPLKPVFLKRLLLLYDEIYLINPEENICFIPDSGVSAIDWGIYQTKTMYDYLTLFDGKNYKYLEEKLIDQFDYCYDKGKIRLLNLRARKFYEKYWLPLRVAYEQDTGNEALIKTALKLIEKRTDFVKEPDNIIRGMMAMPKGQNFYPAMPLVPDLFPPHEEDIYRQDIQVFSAIAKLDRALAVAGEYQLSPIFIDKEYSNLFLAKTSILSKQKDKKLNDAFIMKHNYSIDKIQYFLYEISQQILPDIVLDEIPVKELIIAKENTTHELYKLRRNLICDINFLKDSAFDENYIKESEKYIKNKIEPSVRIYNDKFIDRLGSILNYTSMFTLGAIESSFGFVPGIDPLQIALLTGASATLGNAVSNLANYITNNKRDRIKNTFSYFYDFI